MKVECNSPIRAHQSKSRLFRGVLSPSNSRIRPKNDIGKTLGQMLDYEKAHKPVKLARSRVAAKAAAV